MTSHDRLSSAFENGPPNPLEFGGSGPPPAKMSSFSTLIVDAATLLGAGNSCLDAFGFIQERDVGIYAKFETCSYKLQPGRISQRHFGLASSHVEKGC